MRRRRTGGAGGAAAAALVLAGMLAGCSSFRTFQIESRIPERQIAVDGKADDWAGRLFAVEGRKVSIGFLNDNRFLYVCLRTDDAALVREFMKTGLMVWFDPGGGRKKALGIKHPVGLPPGQLRMWRAEERDGEEPPEFEDTSDLEIYRQGEKIPEGLDIADAKGIEIRCSFAAKRFVYELRIPLAPPTRDAVGLDARPGGMIGVGFETAKPDLSSLSPRSGGMIGGTGAMPPTGAFGGFGGRGGFGRGGRLRPNNPELPESLRLWASVRLGAGR